MVELRKRPARDPPAAPPPASKKKSSVSSKAPATKATESSVASKVKGAAKKAKAIVTGESDSTNDAAAMQPTVEDATTTAGTEPDPAMTGAPVESATAMIPETAATAPGSVTVPTSTPAPAPTTTTTTADADESHRPETSEALENPPETGKVEPATTAAEAAVLGGSIGPAVVGGGASVSSELATVPLSVASVGKLIRLEGFGGVVETHEGKKVSVKELIGQGAAKGGIVIFTYPKASTPGCTQQACLFRDSYTPLMTAGLSVYGLSTDSTKANTTFATKQKLPFPLLCDPEAKLTAAIGMKKPGPGKGTLRGVVVIDNHGVVKVWFQGGPAKTLDAVMEYVKTMG